MHFLIDTKSLEIGNCDISAPRLTADNIWVCAFCVQGCVYVCGCCARAHRPPIIFYVYFGNCSRSITSCLGSNTSYICSVFFPSILESHFILISLVPHKSIHVLSLPVKVSPNFSTFFFRLQDESLL